MREPIVKTRKVVGGIISRIKKYAPGILSVAISLFVLLSGIPAAAAGSEPAQSLEAYNAEVKEKADSLAKKYGVAIKYPAGAGYAGIGTATLATLDACLEYVTPAVMKELSAWYKEKTGSKLTFSYTNTPDFDRTNSGHPIAGFTYEKALIQIFVPRSNNPGAVQTGNSPTAIIHEVGHAVHEYLIAKAGSARLREQWTKLNGTAGYGGGSSYDRNAFVSRYAASDYDEDFADTFAYGYVCNRAGFSIAKYLKSGEKNTVLGDKVALLEKLVASYFEDAGDSVINLKKCWSTPESVSYRGFKFSGNSMEYVGYNAPYGVLSATLKSLGIAAKSSKWERSVGGWVVADAKGAEYMVFPGGASTVLKKAG